MTWNPLVAAQNRFATTNKTNGRPVPKPTHVVCHITGSDDFDSVKNEFMTGDTSIHYLVDQAGTLYQFVEEENTAWHAGVKAPVMSLYDSDRDWRTYLYYFSWDKSYPADAVYLNAAYQPVAKKSAVFVARPDGAQWDRYAYFDTRWGAGSDPRNYAASKQPNTYSVGIEILSFGAKTPSPTAYSPAMYASLRKLVTDICTRHGIPQKKGNVVGHEDVNPVQRYGWDPNQGFDWNQVWA